MSESRVRTVLVIDTATEAVVTGVAVVADKGIGAKEPGVKGMDGVQVRAERSVADHRRHAEVLTTLMAEVMAEAGVSRAEVDAVVVGLGPGPFTGLRVGMATAAGFADALGVPVYGVCSLDAIAAQALADDSESSTVLVATDARRREVYWALYQAGERTYGPAVATPAAVAEALASTTVDAVAGSSAHLSQIGWAGEPPTVSAPSVAGLAAVASAEILALGEAAALVPLYLRRPDAVERKDQRVAEVSGR